ncbi:MAG: hypothetical protein IBX56_02715 [Methylomicrobium sp.]|nr:hypothetical protein [Methylomicrobium sp.]
MITFETIKTIQDDDTQPDNIRMAARAVNATRTFAGDVDLDRAVYSLVHEFHMPMGDASYFVETIIEIVGEMK